MSSAMVLINWRIKNNSFLLKNFSPKIVIRGYKPLVKFSLKETKKFLREELLWNSTLIATLRKMPAKMTDYDF